MNYELAKQLKDAGFPQRQRKGTFPWKLTKKEDCYVPTLSELIEACGDDLEEIKQMKESDLVSYKWEAYTNGYYVVGSTPEEAVANLWIALNKKD